MSSLKWTTVDELELDEKVKGILKERGVIRLNPVQTEAIKKGLLKGKRLLVASPTASGKTLVAELGMISHVTNGGKAVYVVPLRALAQEKYDTLKSWEKLGVKVGITSGDYDSDDEWLRYYDIVVSTYEKLDSLWRRRATWLSQVNYYVLDEVHYINDGERGPVIEGITIRSKRAGNLLALSATVSNYVEIADWLGAEPVVIDWRPVKLREGVLFPEGRRFRVQFDDGSIETVKGVDPIVAFTLRSIEAGGQVLIFRNSRRNAEATARRVAEFLDETENDLTSALNEEDVVNEEREGLEPLLRRGVAYHHAGLSKRTRDLIESAFRTRRLKVIAATPTLAAGVNLPARTVIIGDYHRYNRKVLGFQEEIPVMEYKQMSGRAGRPGFDDSGEAVIVVRNAREAERVMKKYVLSQPEELKSRLGSELAFFSFVLGVLASDGPLTEMELRKFASESLMTREVLERYLDRAINWLTEREFVKLGRKLSLTSFGRRVADLYVNPFTADLIKEKLTKSELGCNLAYLQLLASTPDAPVVSVGRYEEDRLYDELDCELMVEEPEDETERYEFLSSLKVGLIVRDWINEEPEEKILETYNVGSGDLNAVVETMDWLTYSGHHVCNVLGLSEHAKRLSLLNARVKDGVSEELLDLVKIRGVGRKRARLLYDSGVRSVLDVLANPEKVKSILGARLGESVIEQAARALTGLHK
ncbi:DEAD/DEAH box helicase [Sulfodiicoccus acidiphilus]|uniref:DEAD/DEAH box helicase n=1 Tax=Sulfodiicoccus acidiphilus TaxID=1670455 RepID=UPI000F84B52F|nr:DEAD/DEAH box helicase [Sulfodiicoccus acidiphilus]